MGKLGVDVKSLRHHRTGGREITRASGQIDDRDFGQEHKNAERVMP